MQIDWFPILFDAQLVLIVLALVIWVFDDKIKELEHRVFRRLRRRKTGIRGLNGKMVGYPAIRVVHIDWRDRK